MVECTVIKVKTMFGSEDVQYYFKAIGTDILLYWVTSSEKAWNELSDAEEKHKIVNITSFKRVHSFKNVFGETVQCIKNVRFNVVD